MKLTTKHIFYFSALISIFFLGTTSYKVFSDVTKIDPVLESKKELTLEDGDIATMSMTPIEWGIGGGYTDYGSAFTVGAATPFNNNPSSGFMNFSVNLATLNNLGGFGG
ncbi:hypothetical protein [Glaciecola sp. 1036]|uniref:hypothetical protein n=1 Tax=Alteromonadaceae TaxID=72275 RepID=UPI003D018768